MSAGAFACSLPGFEDLAGFHDPEFVFDSFMHVGATLLEAIALEAMVDLYGAVDDFAAALAEYREVEAGIRCAERAA